jgi:hypothetical protein
MAKLPVLFRAYIYPHFVYGIQLFMFCSMASRAKLESLFRRCCRVVLRDTGQFPLISNESVYRLTGVFPLRHLFQYTSAVMLYKILVLKQVPALQSLFCPVAHTRRSIRIVPDNVIVLRVPMVSLESSKRSFAYWGAKLWNSIPVKIRCSESLQMFTKLYREYLLLRLSATIGDQYDILDFV